MGPTPTSKLKGAHRGTGVYQAYSAPEEVFMAFFKPLSETEEGKEEE